MRNAYLVTYDISEPKRLRSVFKIMQGFGEHLQYSVFRCELLLADKVRLYSKLTEQINHKEDQILVVDLGPEKGRAGKCIEALGRKYEPLERKPVVV